MAMAMEVGVLTQGLQMNLTSSVGLRPSSIGNDSRLTMIGPVAGRTVVRGLMTCRAATAVAPQFKTITPLGDRILVKISTVEEKTQGGILLPSTAQSKPSGGEVVAVGEGKTIGDKKIAPSVSTGSNVIYSKFAGTDVAFNGVDHVLLKEDDIVGVLNSDDIKELQPANDRVLIKLSESERKTAGGILLTESAKERPIIGSVVAVGPGMVGEDGLRKPLDIGVGNSVLYSKYAGSDFKSKDGVSYVVMRAADILALLD